MEPHTIVGVSFKVVRWTARTKWFQRVLDQVRPKHHLLVVGTSGMGKSNFINSLTEPSARAIASDDRTKFMNSRTLKLPGKFKPFLIYDTPGERGQVAERTRAILKLSRRRGSFGVINVVAFGYAETAAVPISTALRNGVPSPDYLERQRSEETSTLASWVPSLLPHQLDYFITLVTKADLWYADRVSVVEHYTNGIYAASLKDAGIVNQVVIEYASTIHGFYGSKSPGDFSSDTLIDLRERFQREIERAVSR